MLALGAWVFTVANNRNERRIAWRHDQRARELAADQQKEALLQDALAQLSALLVDKDLRGSDPQSAVRSVARALTLTTLARLDGRRKRSLLRFLYEADLISTEAANNIIPLSGADLHGANLHGATLREANLSEADLRMANVREVQITGTNLSHARLSKALAGRVQREQVPPTNPG